MTSFKQSRLLSCIVFLHERSMDHMYSFLLSCSWHTHMPQLHPPQPASLPPCFQHNRSKNSLLRIDTGEKILNLTTAKTKFINCAIPIFLFIVIY